MKVIEILFVSLRNWITSLTLVMTVFSHSVLDTESVSLISYLLSHFFDRVT